MGATLRIYVPEVGGNTKKPFVMLIIVGMPEMLLASSGVSWMNPIACADEDMAYVKSRNPLVQAPVARITLELRTGGPNATLTPSIRESRTRKDWTVPLGPVTIEMPCWVQSPANAPIEPAASAQPALGFT